MDLGRLLHPDSVAVVGATEHPAAYGSEAVLNLQRLGFGGRLYAVNPRRSSVHGVECVASVADLPEAADAVVVAIPADGAPSVVEAAGARGCGGAVVFAAGFAEGRGGPALQDELVAAASRWDLPVCGPNGNGIVALPHRVALWGDMVAPAEPGPVALISQSGNVAVNALASRRGLRLHTVVSGGNQAVVGASDWLAALAEEPGVRSVALYLEDEGYGAAWCDALERCARAGIGVVVLKAGTSAMGAAAAQAHTGAVAGDGRAFRALMEECGAVWATHPHELLELAKALAVAGRRRGGPAGTAVMTCSGGDASVAADLADDAGLSLPILGADTSAALERLLPPAATPVNPLDYTSLLWDEPARLEALVGTLAADPEVGRVLVFYDEPAGMDEVAAASWAGVLDAVRAAGREADVPVLVSSTLPELMPDASATSLQADGLAAVAGLAAGLRCAAALAGPVAEPGRIREVGRAARRVNATSSTVGPDGWLAEHEAKAMLAVAGLPVASGLLATTEDEAAAALGSLGGPVALKVSRPGLRHKSELGAVVLDVADPATARAAARRLRAVAGGNGATLLVERMAAPGIELLVGARADAIVPVLALGLGGVWTEALDDVVLVPLPATPARVERALRSLRGAPVLFGARGRRVDLGAAARLAAAAGDLLLRRNLALLELNPVIVHTHGATVVDALARTSVPQPQGATA